MRNLKNPDNWYFAVHKLCCKLSLKYNKPLPTVVGILVNFSAQKDWKTNINQTIRFLKGWNLTGMYSNVQYKNSIRILNGEDPLSIWGKYALKYRQFYGSILHPDRPDYVCVDTHMINWYKAKFKSSVLNQVAKEKVFTSKRYYTLIQKAIRKEAKREGLIPSQAQARIWALQRNGKTF